MTHTLLTVIPLAIAGLYILYTILSHKVLRTALIVTILYMGIYLDSRFSSLTGMRGYLLSILPGHHPYTIEVDPEFGFIIILKDGNNTISIKDEWNIYPFYKNNSNKYAGMYSKSHPYGRRYIVMEPGLIIFKMPNILGYKKILDQEVLVKPGEFTEHVIHLQREN